MATDDVVVIDTNSTTVSTGADGEDPLLTKQREAEKHIEYKRANFWSVSAQIAVFLRLIRPWNLNLPLQFDAEPTICRAVPKS